MSEESIRSKLRQRHGARFRKTGSGVNHDEKPSLQPPLPSERVGSKKISPYRRLQKASLVNKNVGSAVDNQEPQTEPPNNKSLGGTVDEHGAEKHVDRRTASAKAATIHPDPAPDKTVQAEPVRRNSGFQRLSKALARGHGRALQSRGTASFRENLNVEPESTQPASAIDGRAGGVLRRRADTCGLR